MSGMTNTGDEARRVGWALFLVAAANGLGNLLVDLHPSSMGLLANITKPLLMPLVAAHLLLKTRGGPSSGSFPLGFIFLALGFGWLGDVLLMLPDSVGQRLPGGAFVWGLVAFLLGHLCYIRAMLRGLSLAQLLEPRGLMAALPMGVYGYILFSVLAPHLPKALVVPVLVYMTALIGTAFSAFARYRTFRDEASVWMLVGALLFLQSDSILAVNRFVFNHPPDLGPMPAANFMLMLTYVLGQSWIAEGCALAAVGTAARRPAEERERLVLRAPGTASAVTPS